MKLPEVRLRLQDLSFLRSLADPEGVRCAVPANVVERLRLLDLVERVNVPPSEEMIRQVREATQQLKLSLKAAAEKEDWEEVLDICHEIQRSERPLNGKLKDVLTDSGRTLLKNGEVTVSVRKAGGEK